MRKLFYWAFGSDITGNSWYLCMDICWATVFHSAQTFNAAYAIRLGASNADISLLVSVPALTAVLVLLPAGRFLQSRQRPQKWLLASVFIARAGTLLAVVVPWLHIGGITQGTLLVILLIMLSIPGHFFNLGIIPFLAQAVPEQHRASTFAARNALAGAILAVCCSLFGLWLSREAFPLNYQVMYALALLVSLVSLHYLSKVKVLKTPVPAAPIMAGKIWRSSVRQWAALLATMAAVRDFKRHLVNTLLYSIGIWAAGPLYVLYYVRGLQASEAWLGTFGAIGSLSTIGGYILWRRFIARYSEPTALKLTIVAMGLYPLLAGLFPSLTFILVVAAINGVITAGVNLSHFTTLLKVIPADKHHDYTALYLTLLNIGAFVCPPAAIFVANRIGFAPALVACGLLSMTGAASFWVWPVGKPQAAPAEMLAESA
jgi:MFS family permease